MNTSIPGHPVGSCGGRLNPACGCRSAGGSEAADDTLDTTDDTIDAVSKTLVGWSITVDEDRVGLTRLSLVSPDGEPYSAMIHELARGQRLVVGRDDDDMLAYPSTATRMSDLDGRIVGDHVVSALRESVTYATLRRAYRTHMTEAVAAERPENLFATAGDQAHVFGDRRSGDYACYGNWSISTSADGSKSSLTIAVGSHPDAATGELDANHTWLTASRRRTAPMRWQIDGRRVPADDVRLMELLARIDQLGAPDPAALLDESSP